MNTTKKPNVETHENMNPFSFCGSTESLMEHQKVERSFSRRHIKAEVHVDNGSKSKRGIVVYLTNAKELSEN